MIWDRPKNKLLDEIATKCPNRYLRMQDLFMPIVYLPQKRLFPGKMAPSWDLEIRIVDKCHLKSKP